MARYSQLDFTQLADIAARYELSLSSFEPWAGGWSNSSFRLITDRGPHVLTVFEESSPEAVERLGALLAHLERNGFATTQVIRPAGGDFATHNDGKPILIKKYIAGRVAGRLTLEMLRRAGAALARLHAVPVPDCVDFGHLYERECYPEVASRGDSQFATWLAQRKSEFERVVAPPMPTGLIHGDLFHDNILFEADELRAVIDFEDACHYFFVFDLGMTVVGLACPSAIIDPHRVQALLDGYQQIRPLRGAEREALKASVVWAAACTACWRYWKFRLRSPDPEHADRFRQLVELADSVRGSEKLLGS